MNHENNNRKNPTAQESGAGNKLYFAIQLEDRSVSKAGAVPKTYFGTKKDIAALIDCLAADPEASIKYSSTIRAFRAYSSGNFFATHTIADRHGRLLKPVKCVHETQVLQENAQWHFRNGLYDVNLRADLADVQQILLKSDGMYLRCIRPCYEKLQVEAPKAGWKDVPGHQGFPYICETEEGWHYMRLFTMEQADGDPEACLARMNDTCYISHRAACDDILGG